MSSTMNTFIDVNSRIWNINTLPEKEQYNYKIQFRNNAGTNEIHASIGVLKGKLGPPNKLAGPSLLINVQSQKLSWSKIDEYALLFANLH